MEGFSGGASGNEPVCQWRRRKRCGFNPWVGKIPWGEGMATQPNILAWEIPGWRSLAGYSPWGHKELDTIETT